MPLPYSLLRISCQHAVADNAAFVVLDSANVGLIGGRTRKNVEMRSRVTLLWPPSEPAG
jgi:hypothetical protein